MTGVQLNGVNLSSGSVHVQNGILGTNFDYGSTADVDYFVAKGLNTFRIAFSASNVAVDHANASVQRILHLTRYAQSKGATIVLDLHDFGHTGSGQLIGATPSSIAEFASEWTKIATFFKDQPNVVFGLMNEPHDQSAAQWLAGANAAIAAVRQVGATQSVLVPGSYWDGAWTWTTTDNASVVGTGIVDPLHNYMIDLHQYLDADSSGTTSSVVAGAGATRLVAATEWGRAHGVHLFLSEYGFAADRASLTEGKAMLEYIAANKDVWAGSTAWTAGDWWGDYMFSVEPTGLGTNAVTDRAQLKVMVGALVPTTSTAASSNVIPASNAVSTTASANPTTPAVPDPAKAETTVALATHDVFRFYDTATRDHFYTTSAAEKAQIQATLPTYHYEGAGFATPDPAAGTQDVYRFYDTATGNHFFTTSQAERDNTVKTLPSYHYEGVAFQAYASEGAAGTFALERFYNTTTGQHHYALPGEADLIRHGSAGLGWVDEGKAFIVHAASWGVV